MKFKPKTEPLWWVNPLFNTESATQEIDDHGDVVGFINPDFDPDYWAKNPHLVANEEGEVVGYYRPDGTYVPGDPEYPEEW